MKTLNKIQKELKAPKGQKNTFGNYNYRSCEDILEAVKPLLGDAVLTITDDIVQVGDRFYVKATATITEDEKSVSVSAFARESLDKKGMDSAQITGATSSYARKYALNGLFCIDDTKDADTKDNTESEKTIQYAPKIVVKATVAPKKDPYETAKEAIMEATDTEALSKIGERITSSTKLTEEQKADLFDTLEARASLI
jgi:hypothetical protein